MKKFNLNRFIYIQITPEGFTHLKKTVGDNYIKDCIEGYKEDVKGDVWYRLQAHQVFSLLPVDTMSSMLYNTNILIDDEELTNL